MRRDARVRCASGVLRLRETSLGGEIDYPNDLYASKLGRGHSDSSVRIQQVVMFFPNIMSHLELLENAYQASADYLESHKRIDLLWPIFHGIGSFEVSN